MQAALSSTVTAYESAILKYLLRDVLCEAMKKIGRWSSNSFVLFLCKNTSPASLDLKQSVSHEQLAIIRRPACRPVPHRLTYSPYGTYI
ncbi:hypothetical protein BGY98DRAFT_981080 [Russula aff. rugulosa BPL654]|nr:hypothetical protein BGY98DRAFT_981080 [Russula aff. rugulosa BPL654]